MLCFVLVTACGRRDKGFMPERLLSEQEMIAVMTDVQIIEADINYQKSTEHEQEQAFEQRREQLREQERERLRKLGQETAHVAIPEDTIVFRRKDFMKISRECYDQLFEHYGITDSIFTQNIRYYTERPVVLERIMDSVMQRLTSLVQQPTDH